MSPRTLFQVGALLGSCLKSNNVGSHYLPQLQVALVHRNSEHTKCGSNIILAYS